jgi:hypothetical protein
MPILSRFGRCFSAGFYAFLGVVAAQTVANIKDNSTLTSEVILLSMHYIYIFVFVFIFFFYIIFNIGIARKRTF